MAKVDESCRLENRRDIGDDEYRDGLTRNGGDGMAGRYHDEQHSGPGKRILLVEDEALIALAESQVLRRRGYHVETVSDGDAAVAAVVDGGVDLVLMDIDLGPGRPDGTVAAQRMLEIADVPIVFLTSHTEREMVERVRGITRYGYVIKNSGEFVLYQAIDIALELFAANRALQTENESRRQAEQRLMKRNQFIQTILDNLPIGLAVNYIGDGRASYMNRQFERIYGWPQESITDIAHFFECVYPDEEYRRLIVDRIQTDLATRDQDRMVWRGIEITRQSGETAVIDAMNIPIYDQDHMISTVVDVTDHHEALKARARSEARYRAVSDNLPNGIVALFDEELRFVTLGGSALRTGPFEHADLVGKTLAEVCPPERLPDDEAAFRAALGGHSSDTVIGYAGRYYRVIVAPVEQGDGLRRGLILTQDITEAQTAMDQHRHVAEQLKLATETAGLGIWSLDTDSQRLVWNDRLYEIYGITPAEFRENPDAWRALVHPEDRAGADRAFTRIAEGKSVQGVRFRIQRPNGDVRVVLASGVPVWSGDSITSLIGINLDITDTVTRERQLEEAISQRETALREASHRIKNHLQTVRSLVSIAESTGAGFTRIKEQIGAIAAAHDVLGQTDRLGQVELRPLFESVVLPGARLLEERGARFQLNVVDRAMPSHAAVPLALIVNELLTNAIFHGVDPESGGFVEVGVREQTGGLAVTVENDGQPLPPDWSATTQQSVGWTIVRELAGQLDATISVQREPTTRVAVEIPETTALPDR